MVVRVNGAIVHSKRWHNEPAGRGGGGGGTHSLGYASLGVRTTYPLAPEQREKKPNMGQRPPRMDDAQAETEEPCPRVGWEYIQGLVSNGVYLY